MPVKGLIKRALFPVVGALTYLEIPFRHHRVGIGREEAVAVIDRVSPRPRCSVAAHNEISPQYDLMVVVPVYNVAPYLEACIESMLTQRTTHTFHIVLVDDGSTDGSANILKRYSTNSDVTVLSKENGGISSARNAGLRHIRGRYVMFVDSDDIVAPNAFETMLDMAYRWDADAVEGSVEFFNDDGVVEVQRRSRSRTSADKIKDLRGQPWAKLYRGSLFEDIQYPEGCLYEDSILAYCVHPRITRAYAVNDIVYRYRVNPQGITVTSRKLVKSLDTVWITDYLFPYFVEHYSDTGKMEQLIMLIDQIALNHKRTEGMEKNVREAVFAVSCSWFHQYFNRQDANLLHGKRRMLAVAVEAGDYGAYELVCSRWRFLNN